MKGKYVFLNSEAVEILDSIRKNSMGIPQRSYSQAVKNIHEVVKKFYEVRK